MTPEQAAETVKLITELWPNQKMTEALAAFFTEALMVIPSQAQALNAVRTLRREEPFPPVPNDVIDLALGVADEASSAWLELVMHATDRQARRPTERLPDLSRIALAAIGGRADILPLDQPRDLDRIRTRFIAEYRQQRLRSLHSTPDDTAAALPAAPATPANEIPVDAAQAIDTTTAARRL